MIDFSLTQEQEMLQSLARDFAQNEIGPIVQIIDQSNNPEMEPWDFCKNVFYKGGKLGFTSLMVPKELGGVGGKCIDLAVVLEEIGAVDVSIACSYFNLTAAMSLFVSRAATQEQQKRILSFVNSREPHLFSAAESEPNVATSDIFCPLPDSNIGMKTFAVREGNGYILNGTKSSLVTNAGIADSYFIIARTAMDKPLHESLSIFYVPTETPGIKFGKKTQMIGWKASHLLSFIN